MNSIFCGRRKEGKTTLAIYHALMSSPGVVVWNPRLNIEGIQVHDADELEAAIENKDYEDGIIVYNPDGRKIREDFEEMTIALFDPPNKYAEFGFSLVIDEASQLQGSNSVDENLDLIIRQHPSTVNVYQTTHSLQDFSRSSKDLMDNLYCFQLKGRSLKAVIEYSDIDEATGETIKNLETHHFYHHGFTAEPDIFIPNDPKVWFKPVVRHNERRVAAERTSRYAVEA